MAEIIDCKTGSVIDSETGEVLGEFQLKKARQMDALYFKTYIEGFKLIRSLQGRQADVLIEILNFLDFDGVARFTTHRRAHVMKILKMSQQNLKNKVYELCKAGALMRIAKGEYMANPYLFTRGAEADIDARRKRFDEMTRDWE